MKEPFKLAQDTISHDTLEAARTLVMDAESGDLIGFSHSGIYRQGHFKVSAAGEAWKSPVFAIGTLIVLIYKLIMKAVGKK
jgi:hypothetical protein